MSAMKGAAELRRRIKAIAATKIFKPIGREWADEAVKLGRSRVPNRNTRYSKGRLHDSIRRKSATSRRAVVTAFYDAYFVDAGVKPHSLKSRASRPKGRGRAAQFQRSVFARTARKGHPGYRARPFRAWMAREALRRKPMSAELIDAWNKAA